MEIKHADRLDKMPPYLFGEIARAKAKAVAEGKDLVDFGIGDPDQPTPKPIIESLCQAANDPETHRYDESDYGVPAFVEVAASWYRNKYGVDVSVADGNLLALIGSKEGLAHLAWAFIGPGDVSLVPDPAYTVYKINTILAGGTPHIMPLKIENGFLPDLTAIPSDAAKKAKLMYINYPNNPTGAVANESFYADVVKFAKEYEIIVCQDAAYSDVTYDGYEAPSFLKIPGGMDVGIEMYSMSKTYNMTGWRAGFAVGNPDVLKMLNKVKSYIDSKQFPAVMLASAHALGNVHNTETFDLYRKRRDIIVEGLNSMGWKLEKPKATLYVWAPVPPGYTSIEFAKALLEQAGVLVVPGIGYGEYGEGYIRLSLTVSGDRNGERVRQGIERMKNNVKIQW